MRGAGPNKNGGPTNLNINKQGDPKKWVVVGGVHYSQWKHSGLWKQFNKTIHGAFRNNRTINLFIRRG